jgi:hypothetical protein
VLAVASGAHASSLLGWEPKTSRGCCTDAVNCAERVWACGTVRRRVGLTRARHLSASLPMRLRAQPPPRFVNMRAQASAVRTAHFSLGTAGPSMRVSPGAHLLQASAGEPGSPARRHGCSGAGPSRLTRTDGRKCTRFGVDPRLPHAAPENRWSSHGNRRPGGTCADPVCRAAGIPNEAD